MRDQHQTDTVHMSRADARAQAGAMSDFMPYVPASGSPFAPPAVSPDALTWAETVAPGGYTHKVVSRGTRIRLDDPTGDACANVVLFNALEPGERLNVADTQKIAWQAYLRAGTALLSAEGRALATILEDTSGRHDAFCGSSTQAWNDRKYGGSAPEGHFPSGRGLLLKAAAKHGLTGRDLPPSVSFFQGVRVDPDGDLLFTGSAGPGTHVTLVAELPVLVLVANVAHPLDPREDYVVGPLRVHAWRGLATPADGLANAMPEHARAYLNSIDYSEGRGL